MATAMFRSSIRSALRGRAPRVTPAPKRTFSSHASVEEEAREASKWEKITYVAIISSTILAVVNLSKGHPHSEEPPAYPYLHIRNKEFPWGNYMTRHFLIFSLNNFMFMDSCLEVQMGFLSPSTIETARFLCEGILNNSYPSASIIVTNVVLKAVEFFMRCLPLDLFSISIAFTLAYLHLQYTLASYKVFFKEIRIER
uniref:Uncharacterized protein n=1 Tax=Solanum lycopersicum TaxID=4081 RepID=A0A3Q7FB23_SOLLC